MEKQVPDQEDSKEVDTLLGGVTTCPQIICTSLQEEKCPLNKNNSAVKNGKYLDIEQPPTDIAVQEEKKQPPKKNSPWKRFTGMAFSLSCSLCLSLSLTVVKMLNTSGYHVFSIGFWRFQGLVYPSLAILLYEICYSKTNPCVTVCPLSDRTKLKMFGVLLVRSVIGSIAMIFLYAASTYIGPPEASSICMSSPILTTILAWLFLGESCGIIPAVATVLNILGMFVISDPSWLFGAPMDKNTLIGIGLALASLCGNTAVVLSLRVLRNTKFSVIGLGFGIGGCITTALAGLVFEGRPVELPLNSWDAFLLVVVGGTAFIGQVCFTFALRFEEAGAVSLLRCIDIVFAYGWQAILLDKLPDVTGLCGTAIIIAGVMLLGSRKLVQGLKEDDPARKRFRFLLI